VDFPKQSENIFVKVVLAILFSVMLAAAPLLASGAPAMPCAKTLPACCQQGQAMPCCAAQSSSDSKSAPAVPAQSGPLNQILLPAPTAIAWVLPAGQDQFSASIEPLLTSISAPLFARNCVRLI